MNAIDINIERELNLAHQDYEIVKKAVLYNQKAVKQCYRKLYNSNNISKETYKSLVCISNSTIKFINMKEI